MDWITVLAIVVCFLVLVVAFKHVELQIRINNILDVNLKANKENEVEEEQDSKKEETPVEERNPQ
ncbi:hypothetical protein [Brevibacillus migulae]|uniref:hypothetical protein n=1 Tax=Brevibacillus migulae TaxID=1644114 RepID=UPI00106DE480|nr:hypothetical protein [Brevibacillus migulae]